MDSRMRLDARAAGGASGGGGADDVAREPGLEARLLHVWSLLRVVWTGRWFLIAGVIAGLLGVVVYSVWMPVRPMYVAEARLYVRPISGVATAQGQAVPTTLKQAAHAEAALLTSTSLIADTVNHADVADMPEVYTKPDRVGFLRGLIGVSVGRDDGLITVRTEMPSPTNASRLINAHVDTYLAYHDKLNRSTTGDVLGLLNAEREHLEQTLTQEEAALTELRAESGIAGLPGDALDLLTQSVNATSAELTRIDRETKAARDDEQTIQKLAVDPAALARFLRTRDDARTKIDPVLHKQILDIRRYRASLLTRFGPRSPVIQALDRQLEELEAGRPIDDQPDIAVAIERIRERRIVLETQREQTAAALAEQQARLAELHTNQAAIVSLERGIERTRTLLDRVHARVQMAGLTEAAPPITIAVLDRATPATAPVAGRRRQRYMEGAALGFALGLAVLTVHGLVRRRLGTADDVEAALGAPVIATLPKLDDKLTDRARGQYLLARGSSPYAEACRALRTAVLFAGRRARGSAIAITSPIPGMGKSTVTANLGVCIAQTGRRTLIVDADLRRPRQHRFFDIDTDRSIADVLRDSQEMQLRELVHRTPVVGLDVLVCGSPAESPSEILTSRIFTDAFDQLRKGYDIVLIDCPPLLSVTDAQLGAALADQTICVLNADTLARPVLQARRALEAVGAELFGAVVNAAPAHRGWLMRFGGFDRYGTNLYGYETDKDAA